jgi:hypothetical protein
MLLSLTGALGGSIGWVLSVEWTKEESHAPANLP